MVGWHPVENMVVHTEGGGNFVGGGRAVQRCGRSVASTGLAVNTS